MFRVFFKRAVILVSIFLWPCGVHQGLAQFQQNEGIEHFPIAIAEQGKDVEINARLRVRAQTPVYVRVYFKSIGEQNFRHLDLRQNFDNYVGVIPAQYVQPPVIQYFILALFPNQQIVSFPELNPYGKPLEIVVEAAQKQPQPAPGAPGNVANLPIQNKIAGLEASQGAPGNLDSTYQASGARSAASTVIISPDVQAEVSGDEVVIAASFLAGDAGVDVATVKLSLDGNDMTSAAEVSEYVVSYTARRVLPGVHTAIVVARDTQGNILPPLVWKFNVVSSAASGGVAEKKAYSGRVYAEFRQEKFSGRTLNANNLGGNIDGTYGAFSYHGMAYITSLEDARFQPRNRFSLSITSKVLEFGAGDLYPYYNDLVLWGRRVRGFSAALNLGFINFQFISGQTNRVIKPIYTTAPGTTTPTLTSRGGYSQMLTAGRLSFGGGKNFQLGLLLLKVRDDVGSLKTGESFTTPKDNLVVGADFLLAFDSHRFEIKASAAFSLLTNDITNGPVSKDKLQETFDFEVPIDPESFKSWIILNESMIPLDPRDLTSLAYQTALRLNYFGNYFQLGYKTVGSAYTSLGQTYLRNNIRGFFIDDRVRLLRNKVYLNLGYEDNTDNYDSKDGNPETALRTVNYGISYYPGKNLPIVNFGVRNYVRDNGIDQFLVQTSPLGVADTTDNREQSLTRDINFNLSHNFQLLDLRHTATLSIINSRLIDHFESSRPATTTSPNLQTTVQMLSLKSEFERPLITTLTLAKNKNESGGGLNGFHYTMLSARADYRILNDRLTLSAGLRSVGASGDNKSPASTTVSKIDYSQTSLQLGAIFQPSQHHAVSFDADIIKYSDKGGVFDTTTMAFISKNPSFNNSIVRLLYEYRF